jgi:hypothetical protein
MLIGPLAFSRLVVGIAQLGTLVRAMAAKPE